MIRKYKDLDQDDQRLCVSMIKNAMKAATAIVIGQGMQTCHIIQVARKLSTDISLKNSLALSKKLTAEMQSVCYAFHSGTSTLIKTLFDLRAQVEQSFDPQV